MSWIPDDDDEATEGRLTAELVTTLAGRAAEEVIVGSVSAYSGGPEFSDLAQANDLAFRMEATLGLAKAVIQSSAMAICSLPKTGRNRRHQPPPRGLQSIMRLGIALHQQWRSCAPCGRPPIPDRFQFLECDFARRRRHSHCCRPKTIVLKATIGNSRMQPKCFCAPVTISEVLHDPPVHRACAITADPAKVTAFLPRPAAREEYSRFSPEVLALAGRTILSWPKGFDRLAFMARENADLRKGHFGIKKELGALLALRLDPHIEPGLCEESRTAIEQDMRRTATGYTMVRRKENLFREDLMTMEQASKHLGITRKTMRRLVDDGAIGAHRAGTAERAPVLVSRNEIEAILKARKGFVPAASLSKKFGFPVMVLQSLATAGILEERANPTGLAPGSYYVEASVEALLEQLDSRAHPISTRTNLVDLRRAALLAGSPRKNPWPNIFRGVLAGQLKLFSRGSGKAVLGRYFLEETAISRISEMALTWPEPADCAPLMRADIGFLLDIPTPSVYALIQDGILSRRPSLDEVQLFHDLFVLSKEAARLLQGREDLDDWQASNILSSSELEPAYTTTYKKRRVWQRRSVLQLARSLPRL